MSHIEYNILCGIAIYHHITVIRVDSPVDFSSVDADANILRVLEALCQHRQLIVAIWPDLLGAHDSENSAKKTRIIESQIIKFESSETTTTFSLHIVNTHIHRRDVVFFR